MLNTIRLSYSQEITYGISAFSMCMKTSLNFTLNESKYNKGIKPRIAL